MSFNPSELHELLRQILSQQQQLEQGQQQQGHAQPAAPPEFQQCNQGPALPLNPGPLNQLENPVAQYLHLSGSQSTMSVGEPAIPAIQMQTGNIRHDPSLAPFSSNQTDAVNGNNPSQQNQQLLALSNLLAAATAQQTAIFSASQQQQRQSFYPDQPHQQSSLNLGRHEQQQNYGPVPTLQAQQQLVPLPQQQHQQGSVQDDQLLSSTSSTLFNKTFKAHPSTEDIINNTSKEVHFSFTDNQVGVGQEVQNLPPEPVPISILQSWNLVQLESHAKRLKESNKPVPKIVELLIKNAHEQEERRLAKRLLNRKSATASRARKRQIMQQLTADNLILRRQALILNYLPDPIITIGLDGKILFCNKQVQRELKYNLGDLEGTYIKDILLPGSMDTIHRLIQESEASEYLAAERGEGNDSGSESHENVGQHNSGRSSNNAAISRSSDQSFNVLEVDVNDQNKIGNGDNTSDSSSGPSRKKVNTGKSCSTTTSSSGVEENDKLPENKSKNTASSGSDWKTSDIAAMDVDDVMGDSVTANNAGAKLSSLMHCPDKGLIKDASNEDERKMPAKGNYRWENEPHIHRKRKLAPRTLAQKQDSQSSSSTDSDRRPRADINSSEDSGYMDSNSYGSSDEFGEDSSTSGNSMGEKGNKSCPSSPGSTVNIICNDLTTLLCEVTASTRTRTPNDEGAECGKGMPEREVLLCFRPLK